MRVQRLASVLALLVLLLGGLLAGVPHATAGTAPIGRWVPVAPPSAGSAGLVSDLLPLSSGRALLLGGAGSFDTGYTRASQRYDPATNTWSAPAPLAAGYLGSVNVALADGRALATGGGTVTASGSSPPSSATTR